MTEVITRRSAENMRYVRQLLSLKQPVFAETLELAVTQVARERKAAIRTAGSPASPPPRTVADLSAPSGAAGAGAGQERQERAVHPRPGAPRSLTASCPASG